MYAVDDEIKLHFEFVEGDAWIDVLKSASPETIKLLGSGYKSIGTAKLSYVKQVDTLALNRVTGFGLDGNTDIELLNSFKAEFRSAGVTRFFLQIYPDLLTDELQSNLKAAGYSHYNNWVKLYRDASDPKEIFTDVAVMKIDKDHADPWAEIVHRAFEWKDILLHLLKDFVGSEKWNHYIGYYNGMPVSAASSFIDGEYCWMGFAATLKEYRSLGSQHAMIHKRIVDGISKGCKHFIVETAQNSAEKKSQSYLNITNMGFKPVYLRPNYIHYIK